MATTDEKFGREVERLREAAGMSMTQFAARLADAGLTQFHPNTVARVERGERPIRLSEAVQIAEVLGVAVESLIRTDSPDAALARVRVQRRIAEAKLSALGGCAEEALDAQESLRGALQRIASRQVLDAAEGVQAGRDLFEISAAKKLADSSVVDRVHEAVQQWHEMNRDVDLHFQYQDEEERGK